MRMAVSATEFAKNFGRYKEEAQREPVAITSHGRISGYFVSEREFKELQRLRNFEHRVYRLQGLPSEIADAIEAARMDPKRDHLSSLLDDQK
jgi:PHD/YefM family antitoxin component YafN of YafNO toxin-antitoxin module